MSNRANFEANNGSSTYFLSKRLVVEEDNGGIIKVPIEVSDEIENDNGTCIYRVNGCCHLNDEILTAVICAEGDCGREYAENAKILDFVRQFWNDEAEIIRRLYEGSNWRVEEKNYDRAYADINKYSVFGDENAWGYYYGNRTYWERNLYMIYAENKTSKYSNSPAFDAHSVRTASSFSYFNKYVRSSQVYFYNTEYNASLLADADYVCSTAGKMLARSFDNAAELVCRLCEKKLLPIFGGELPKPGEYPKIPSDIWLLVLNETGGVDDLIAVELAELDAWISAYSSPASEQSLWEDIRQFIESHADDEYYYESEVELYLKYWDAVKPEKDEWAEADALALRNFWNDLSALDAGTNDDASDYDELLKMNKEELLSVDIERLELSVRAYNCLKRAGIDTIADLVATNEAELIKIRNLGKKSKDEVIAKIESLGFQIERMATEEGEKNP